MHNQNLTCHISKTLGDALRCIDRGARGIACLVNDDREVVAILTDGDIRRALLSGAFLDTPVERYANYDFFWLPSGLSDEEYVEPLLANRFLQVVVLDERKRLVAVLARKDLHAETLPVASINLAGNELKYVEECIRSNWISSQGKFVKEFERVFAEYHDIPFALTTTNGTAALHLALLGIGLEPGDEVIVPVSTFGATANAVIHAGGVPVFVDIHPDTWCIDPALIEQAITPKTKAIIPVHLYGHPADMPAISSIAARFGLKVIEDCAESLGATINGKLTGTMSDVACFSFFSNKVITTGEGGMVLTRDPAVQQRMRQYRDHGTSLTRKYWHDFAGYNYRMTNIQAAIGLAQMERIEDFLGMRAKLASEYDRLLRDIPALWLPGRTDNTTNIFWLYTVVVNEDSPISRDSLIKALSGVGVDSRPFFPALYHQPAYRAYLRGWVYPVGLRMEQDGLSLPTSNYMGLDDVGRVCNTLRTILLTASGGR